MLKCSGMKESVDNLCSKLRITLSANFASRNLKDCDVFSKSDPMCVVYLSSGDCNVNASFKGALRGDQYFECGRTEMLSNCLNAEWSKTICVDYFFEEIQRIKFEVYDIDSPSSNLSDHDFIGCAETTLAEIVGGPSCRRTFSLRGKDNNRSCGELTVVAEEAETESKEAAIFALRAIKLDRKQFLGKSDPFLQIYRINDDGSSQLVHRTEVITKKLDPEWKPFEISMQQLCGSNKKRESRNFIGRCEVEFDKLVGKNDLEFPLINEKKRKKKGSNYINSGRLIFMSVTTHRNFSFLEFIAGGTQLDFTVAIDMTASNGRVTEPSSLHFIGQGQSNEYHIAIRAVADICQHYNNSKMFDAMGFGAKIPPQNFVNHCFPLNIGSSSFAVFGVAGLLEAYQRCLMSCILYGPTNFAPVISEASKKAASYPRNGSTYQILLIITDGCICDFDQTLSAIIAASYLPMSIIIIGVGGENFDNMTKLDSDDALLTYQGRKAQRDIVQFVPLRQFLGGKGMTSSSFEGTLASAQLAKEVLAEIPDQLSRYMKLNNIEPRPSTNPFPSSPPPPQPAIPAVDIGATDLRQGAPGWVIPQPTQQIGFVGVMPPAGAAAAPYPTIPSSQYPSVAQFPVPPVAGFYPDGAARPSIPPPGSQASGITAGVGFTTPLCSGGYGQLGPPSYAAFDEGDVAFAHSRTGAAVGDTGRVQPSAPPPP